MSEKRSASLVTVSLPKGDKDRLKALAEKEQRTVSNLACVLLREALKKREKVAA
jgi:hypothetical protein